MRINRHQNVFVGFNLLLLGFIGIADSSGAMGHEVEDATEFRSLFDGSTLDGWHFRPHTNPFEFEALGEDEQDAKKAEYAKDGVTHWSVEDGQIVNDGKGPFLVTDQAFENYELHLQYNTVANADSGIYLKDTPQVQIWDVTNESQFKHQNYRGSGGLWNNSAGAAGKDPLVMADRPLGQWNDVRVIQVGARTSVYLNDQLVVDHALMENYWNRDKPIKRRGHIQLQTHGGEIRWRNIHIKSLSADQANEILQSHQSVAYRSLINDPNTFEGWAGTVDDYQINDGIIKCRPGRGGNLFTKEEFGNFSVRLKFKLPPGGNNGLAIRYPGKGNPAYDAMCEIQVLDTEHPKFKSIDPRQAHGSVYGMVAPDRGYLRDNDEWNFQQVDVTGSTVRVELNGYEILKADLSEVTEFMGDTPHPGKDRTTGHFGFAGHSDPVEFKDVQVRKLP